MNIEVKTNFTSGQISKNIYGRGDLSIFENGARSLENLMIHPAGGVSRRYGTKYLDHSSKKCKLIPFEFNTEQRYLFCFYNLGLKIYKNDICIKIMPTPWNEKQVFEMNWVQSADTLLIVHKDVAPRKIVRNNEEDWIIENWTFHMGSNNILCCPFYNFHNKTEYVSIEDYSVNYCGIRARNPIFNKNYADRFIKINGGMVKVLDCGSPTTLYCIVYAPLLSLESTPYWEEEIFSDERGWPATITFHQDRLILGGSRSLPNHLWISRSSDIFNFDEGSGYDDDGMSFAILSDQVNAIKAVVSSRHLLIFTTGAEWVVEGEPLTPSSLILRRQTTVGSYIKYNVHPQQVDGATVFLSRSGRQLREFLYTDVEEAYQATNLTLMSEGIIEKPTDMSFDSNSNILYISQEDGTISCLTTYRTEQVNAWSKMKTEGEYISLCVSEEDIYFCVKRGNKYFIERMEKDFFVDCGIELSSENPKKNWSGLDHLEGQEISVVADGFFAGRYKVKNGSIDLLDKASKIYAGFSYEHIIEPLPYVVEIGKPYPPKAYRMILGIFRLLNTNSFYVDLGSGYFSVPLRRVSDSKLLDAPPLNFSGDVQLRSLGWIRNMEETSWSIKSDEPSSFTLLSVLSEIKTKE